MRGIARRPAGERGYDVLACADLALVAAACVGEGCSFVGMVSTCAAADGESERGGSKGRVAPAQPVPLAAARASVG